MLLLLSITEPYARDVVPSLILLFFEYKSIYNLNTVFIFVKNALIHFLSKNI